MTDRQTLLLFAALAAVAVLAWGAYFYVRSGPRGEAPEETPAASYTFPPVAVEAKSAVVYDLATGKMLFEKNAEAQLPLASLAKLMLPIALPAENQTVAITKDDLAPEGESSLRAGERWRLSDLLDFTLAMSVNDGAHALAAVAAGLRTHDGQASSSNLNELASRIGLRQTYFLNPTGLDVSSSTAGAYGSARDVALMMKAALRKNPAALEATTFKAFDAVSEDGVKHPVINTNPLAGKIPGLIASKTGFTDLAHGNVAIAVDVGLYHPVAIIILDSSYEGRFRDAETLLDATRRAFSSGL